MSMESLFCNLQNYMFVITKLQACKLQNYMFVIDKITCL